jgi:ketosteroid isomerase-like protein
MPAATPQTCLDEFVAAMLRRDMPGALALLTDDAVLFYSNGTAIWGKDAFAANMTAAWKAISDYTYKTVETKWVVQSDTVATVIYTLAWSGKVNGNAVGGEGRGTRVLRRDAQGWRIAHEHLSSGSWK